MAPGDPARPRPRSDTRQRPGPRRHPSAPQPVRLDEGEGKEKEGGEIKRGGRMKQGEGEGRDCQGKLKAPQRNGAPRKERRPGRSKRSPADVNPEDHGSPEGARMKGREFDPVFESALKSKP